MPTSQEMPEALSIWHFIANWTVWLALLASLYNAAIGVLGMNAVQPEWRKWPRLIWVAFALGVILAIGIGLQTASNLRDAEHDKKIADVRYAGINGQLQSVQGQQNATATKLSEISAQNAKLQTALDSLGTAAHIPAGGSIDEIVEGVIKKLPKGAPTPAYSLEAPNNTGIVTQHQTGGSNTQLSSPNQ
jgi:hypothetical protein